MQNENNETNEREIRPEELDEVLEIRMNKTKARWSQNFGEDDDSSSGTPVLSQRLHREATTRTKRAQKMQEAYHRSMGLANHTPQSTGYARVSRENGHPHWTIKRK